MIHAGSSDLPIALSSRFFSILKALEAKRKELEKSIASRPMLAIFGNNIDSLKTFAGINVLLEYLPGEETNAASLRGVIGTGAAGWNIVQDRYNPNILKEGVTIWRHLSPLTFNGGASAVVGEQDEKRSEGAANGLAEFLRSSGWEDATVEMGSRADGPLHVPSNAVSIHVLKMRKTLHVQLV